MMGENLAAVTGWEIPPEVHLHHTVCPRRQNLYHFQHKWTKDRFGYSCDKCGLHSHNYTLETCSVAAGKHRHEIIVGTTIGTQAMISFVHPEPRSAYLDDHNFSYTLDSGEFSLHLACSECGIMVCPRLHTDLFKSINTDCILAAPELVRHIWKKEVGHYECFICGERHATGYKGECSRRRTYHEVLDRLMLESICAECSHDVRNELKILQVVADAIQARDSAI